MPLERRPLKGVHVSSVYLGRQPNCWRYRRCNSSSAAPGLSVTAHLITKRDTSSTYRIRLPAECAVAPFTRP